MESTLETTSGKLRTVKDTYNFSTKLRLADNFSWETVNIPLLHLMSLKF